MDLLRTITLFVALAAAAPATASAPGDRAALIAQQYVGTPYRFGGATPAGFDCSGLVHFAYRQAGIPIPRTVAHQQATTVPVVPEALRTGDLLFFRLRLRQGARTHVGIYLGDGRFVHAPSRGKQVDYADFRSAYWQARFIGAGRTTLAP